VLGEGLEGARLVPQLDLVNLVGLSIAVLGVLDPRRRKRVLARPNFALCLRASQGRDSLVGLLLDFRSAHLETAISNSERGTGVRSC